MSRDSSPTASLLRLLALFGTGATLLWHVASVPPLEPRQGTGFLVLTLSVLAVGFTLTVLLPDAVETLRRHTDLLVPLGLFVTAGTAFNALAALPALAAVLSPSWTLSILTFGFSLSAGLVFALLINVVYVGWTTTLIFQAVVTGRVELVAGLTIIGRWFWRVLALECFGWGVLFAFMAVMLWAGAALTTPALLLLAAASLLWNLATAALLPVALADTGSFRASLRRGLAVSRAGRRRWARLVVVQMLLLGWVTFVSASYTVREERQDGAQDTVIITEKKKADWHVNGFWTGGYADESKWHEDAMKTMEAKPLELVDSLLTLLFAVLAVAVKLRIVGDLYRPAPEPL